MFRVRASQCSTCIYKDTCPLDIEELEAQIADGYGGFTTHRQCHHTSKTPACCNGFWTRHKDKFQAGQLAQRLNGVEFVTTDELETDDGR